ncbi:MAG: ChbG/HpnK family deacetylase [Desulfatibacillum sp.]|nr:ChbG/HpnK family deacetylase [Desulfatibacillum sp.]
MKLIVHGDDFGLTPGVNQGIVRAYSQGILTSTSLVASGDAFDDAIGLARQHTGLDVGVHLTLTDEKPLTQAMEAFFTGETLPSRQTFTLALAMGRLDLSAAKRELCAQVEKVLDSGIAPTHLDSHQFVHLLPGIFPLCLAIRKQYHIPFMRTVVKERTHRGLGLKRSLQWAMLKTWVSRYVKPRLPSELPIIPCTGFLQAGGRLTAEDLIGIFGHFSGEAVLEVMLHPGSGDLYTKEKYAHWGYEWKQDMDLCTAPGMEEQLKKMGVNLCSFRGLA